MLALQKKQLHDTRLYVPKHTQRQRSRLESQADDILRKAEKTNDRHVRHRNTTTNIQSN